MYTKPVYKPIYPRKKINTLFTGLGWSVLGKTVPSVLSMALGLLQYSRPRAQFFPIRTSRPVNNIYILQYISKHTTHNPPLCSDEGLTLETLVFQNSLRRLNYPFINFTLMTSVSLARRRSTTACLETNCFFLCNQVVGPKAIFAIGLVSTMSSAR